MIITVKRLHWIGLLMFSGTMTLNARAQTPAVQPHCNLQFQDHYTCDRAAFLKRLDRAHTVRIDADRLDLFGAHAVQELADGLGKQVTGADARPDLIFDLRAVDRSGRIDLGPGDKALATLSIYDPAKGEGNRGLIWVETFDGQEDRPWPTVVTDLLRRFQEHALTRGN